MSNLKPEVRVNKHGVPVVKHVLADSKPTGLLSRLIPHLNNSYKKALSERRAELLNTFTDRLKEEMDERFDAYNARIMAESDPDAKADLVRYAPDVIDDYESHDYNVKEINSLSTGTLEMVNEAFNDTGDLTSLVRSSHVDEDSLRAALNFRQFLMGRSHEKQTFEDVKKSMVIDDLSDIDPESEFHASVSLVLNVATEACGKRTSSLPSERYPGAYQDRHHDYESLYEEEKGRIHMTSDLASVILDYPDRCDDIVEYLGKVCDGLPSKADGGHLRLYLDNPTPALAEGIL